MDVEWTDLACPNGRENFICLDHLTTEYFRKLQLLIRLMHGTHQF